MEPHPNEAERRHRGFPEAELELIGTELEVPEAEMVLTGTELELPGDELTLAGTELELPEAELALPGTELELPEAELAPTVVLVLLPLKNTRSSLIFNPPKTCATRGLSFTIFLKSLSVAILLTASSANFA